MELKSTSGKHKWRGYRAERSVVQLLSCRQWKLAFQNLRTDIGEIDLVLIKENEVLLIEVKTLDNSWRAFERVHPAQLNKLRNNKNYLGRIFKEFNFKSIVAWVDNNNKVSFVRVD